MLSYRLPIKGQARPQENARLETRDAAARKNIQVQPGSRRGVYRSVKERIIDQKFDRLLKKADDLVKSTKESKAVEEAILEQAKQGASAQAIAALQV